METSGATPHVGVSAKDLPELAELVGRPGPFATVALDTDRAVEKGGPRFELRWKDQRLALRDAGAPDDVLDRVGEWLSAARLEGPSLGVVAGPDGRVVTAVGHDELGRDQASWDSLPRVGPMVAWHQASPPALLVVVDRTGADILLGGRDGGPVEVVEGDDGPDIRRSSPGGWSQRNYQQLALERWRANAKEVAGAVREHVARVEPRLVAVAGDERATELLVHELAAELGDRLRRVSGGRGAGSEGHLEDDAARMYRTVVAEDTVTLLEALKQELGQRDRGVAGVVDTIAALRTAAVDTLVLHDDPTDERRLFFSVDDPLSVGVAESDLAGAERRDGRLADVLVRAAWAGGASVRLTPRIPELADGVGALLRFSRDAVPSFDS